MKWLIKLNYVIALWGVLILLYDTDMRYFWYGVLMIGMSTIVYVVAERSPELKKYL